MPEVGEERIGTGPEEADAAHAPRGSRTVVTLLALGAVALAVAAGLALGGGLEQKPVGTAGDPASDPTAILDSALADGTPAYLLIHSSS